MSATGGITLSTTGTAVLNGSINLSGLPVAEGTLALSLTNSQGDIDPSFAGVAKVALGPLELGNMSMALRCDGCFNVLTGEFNVWMVDTAGTLSPAVQQYLLAIMDQMDPIYDDVTGDLVRRSLQVQDLSAWWFELVDFPVDPQRTLAFVTAVMNMFQAQATGVANYPVQLLNQLGEDVPMGPILSLMMTSFQTALTNVLVQVQPEICFSGQVGPKLFGIPLTGGVDSIFGAGMLLNTVEDAGMHYSQFTAQASFSPSQALLFPVLGTYAAWCPRQIRRRSAIRCV